MDKNNILSSGQKDDCFRKDTTTEVFIKIESTVNDDFSPDMQMKLEPPEDYNYNYTVDVEVKEEPVDYGCDDEEPNYGDDHSDNEVLARQSCAAVYYEELNHQEELITPDFTFNYSDPPIEDGKPYCTICHCTFAKKNELNRHIRTAHKLLPIDDPGKYKCIYCGHRCTSKKAFEQHIATHAGKKPYQCENCRAGFMGEFNYKRHIAKNRCKKRQIYNCEHCTKTFEKKSLYTSHLRSHSTDRNYICDFCDEAFKYRSTIVKHVRVHTGEKTATCPVCHKVFNHGGLVKPHMKVHTKERPFGCPLCHKRFTLKHNAKKHVLIHARQKILSCWICHKVFPKESRLKYHMQTHTKEKPYSCDICKRNFSHKQNVLRHLQRKHPETTTLYGKFR